ncbi:hypothetical protein FOL47_003068 [Perkinsus chesapeaki]|uniref:Uncharacterized protein n=1 Tax=Perkinsus chesapeaki TaxID=330153 RepID=A0A7J6M9U4_PERCH|nr:hypothetical protein FOL47_003068 [Perkinsus chesapeaki]
MTSSEVVEATEVNDSSSVAKFHRKVLKNGQKMKECLTGAKNITIGDKLWKIVEDAVKEQDRIEKKYAEERSMKDKFVQELAKVTVMNEKLEKLCKALQEENRRVREEARRISEGVEEKQANMQKTVTEVMSDFKRECEEMEEGRKKTENENAMLREKLRGFLEDVTKQTSETESKQKVMVELLEQYKKTHHEQSEVIQKLSGERDALMVCVKKQRSEIDEYSGKVEEMGGIFSKSTEALKKLKSEVDSLKRDRGQLEQKLRKEASQRESLENLMLIPLELGAALSERLQPHARSGRSLQRQRGELAKEAQLLKKRIQELEASGHGVVQSS